MLHSFMATNTMETVIQADFCGNASLLWDPQLTLNTSVPDLTPCFQDVLSCVPISVLMLTSLFYFPYLYCLPVLHSSRHRTRLCYAKQILSSLLFVLQILSLGYLVVLSLQIIPCENCTLPSPARYTNTCLHLLAYIYIIILVEVEFTRGCHTSGLCFVFWLLEVAVQILVMRSLILQQHTKETNDLFITTITGMGLTLSSIQFILTLFADVVVISSLSSERVPLLNGSKPNVIKVVKNGNPSPEKHATFLSIFTHFWLTGLLIRSFKNTLQSRDLYDLKADDTSAAIEPRFRLNWKKYSYAHDAQIREGDTGRPEVEYNEPLPRHLLGTLLTTAKGPLITSVLLRSVICFSEYLNPLLLIVLINWVGSKDQYLWKGIFLCFTILITNIINSLLTQQFFKYSQVTSMRVRTALVTAIYRKTLKLTHLTQHQMGSGEIANLMSVDAQKIHDTCNDMHELWAGPLMVLIGMTFLWQVIGPSCLAGLALIVVFAPINGGFLVRRFASYQDQQMVLKDKRIHLINEILAGIKVLKLYAWELAFSDRVDDVRIQELRTVRSQGYLNAGVGVIWYCTPYLVSLAMFSTYVLSSPENYLTPDITFVSLLLINTLNWSMTFIPILLATAAQAFISVKRITEFMKQAEINPSDVNHDDTQDPVIRIRDGNFSWNTENGGNGELKDINLDIGEGQLVVVVGQVGSGKSSLVAAILGEMPRRHGFVNVKKSTGYVAQQAWIQNDTLRNNILFGKEFDPHLYQKVIRACALEPDFKQLLAGDHTEIGEKGINLSGGQKQRVALARAVYQNRDVYLFDDALSAVDAHVSRHIFEHVIGPNGLLKRKTRLLVTHSIPYGSEADLIVVMKNGSITEAGSFLNLVNQSAGNFASLAVSYLNKTEEGATRAHDLSAAISLKEMTLTHEHSGTELSALLTSSSMTSEKDTNGTLLTSTPARPVKIKKQRKRKTRSLHKEEVTSSMKFVMESQTMQGEVTDGAKLMTEEASAEGSISLVVLWSYIKACSVWMAAILLFLQFVYITSLAVTSIWLSAWTDDGATGPPTEDTTNFRLEVFAGLGLIQMISVGGISIVIYLGSLRASGSLHQSMLSRIVKAPMWFFDTTPLGRIVNRFSTDMDKLDSNIPQSARLWLFNLAALCSIIVVIIYSTPVFIVVAVPIMLLYSFIQRVYIKFIRQVKRIDAIRRSPVYVHFDETLAGISSIRAFHQQAKFIATCDHLVDESQTAWYPIIIGQRWLAVLLDILGAMVVFFAALFAVLQRDSLSPGLTGLSVSFAMQTSWAVSMLVRGASDLETHMVAVERIQEYSQVPNEGPLTLDQELEDDWPTEGRVDFRHYSANYRPGTGNVLNDVSFDITSAEKFAIVGRTGAGKSSIALALFRMLQPAGGSVSVDDVNVNSMGLHKLRRRLAIIPQDPVLFSGSIRHNLDPLGLHEDSAIWETLDHAHLKGFVTSLPLQLEHDCGEGGSSLSVGQRQLVCLARALLCKSQVLVLDEATAAVDVETDLLIQSSLRNNLGSSTLITIAHRINTILDYDRVCVMENGKVAELGNPEDLLKIPSSIFRQMAVDAGLIH